MSHEKFKYRQNNFAGARYLRQSLRMLTWLSKPRISASRCHLWRSKVDSKGRSLRLGRVSACASGRDLCRAKIELCRQACLRLARRRSCTSCLRTVHVHARASLVVFAFLCSVARFEALSSHGVCESYRLPLNLPKRPPPPPPPLLFFPVLPLSISMESP